MLNNKYATVHKTYFNGSTVHEYKQGFLAINKFFSTCILFLSSEVTKELVKIIVDMKLLSHFTTTTMLLHLTHIIPHTCTRIQVWS
jgi:hypothetical protein